MGEPAALRRSGAALPPFAKTKATEDPEIETPARNFWRLNPSGLSLGNSTPFPRLLAISKSGYFRRV